MMENRTEEKRPLLQNVANESHFERVDTSERAPHDEMVGEEHHTGRGKDDSSLMNVNVTRGGMRISKDKSDIESGVFHYKDSDESDHGSPKKVTVTHSLNSSYSTPTLESIGGESPRKRPRKDHYLGGNVNRKKDQTPRNPPQYGVTPRSKTMIPQKPPFPFLGRPESVHFGDRNRPSSRAGPFGAAEAGRKPLDDSQRSRTFSYVEMKKKAKELRPAIRMTSQVGFSEWTCLDSTESGRRFMVLGRNKKFQFFHRFRDFYDRLAASEQVKPFLEQPIGDHEELPRKLPNAVPVAPVPTPGWGEIVDSDEDYGYGPSVSFREEVANFTLSRRMMVSPARSFGAEGRSQSVTNIESEEGTDTDQDPEGRGKKAWNTKRKRRLEVRDSLEDEKWDEGEMKPMSSAPKLADVIQERTKKSTTRPGVIDDPEVVRVETHDVHVDQDCEEEEEDETGVVWVDLQEPTSDDMCLLVKMLKLHPLSLDDVFTPNHHQKTDNFGKYIFLILRSLVIAHYLEYNVSNIHVVIFKDFVVTIHERPLFLIRSMISRLSDSPVTVSRYFSSSYILQNLFDSNTSLFEVLVQQLEAEVTNIDQLVSLLNTSESSDLLRRIGHARIRNAVLGRTLTPQRRIFRLLSMQAYDNIDEEGRLYIRDTLDQVLYLLDSLEFSNQTLLNSNQNYMTQIEIEIAKRSNAMNVLGGKFASIATIVLPMTLVAGMWGMNVRVPGQDEDDLSVFYIISSVFMLTAIIQYLLFRRQNIL